uniref:Uncharacterized protein n=1 Tax=Anopheles dirus TaxID=7168 RepID=A0A182NSV4_9DIPT
MENSAEVEDHLKRLIRQRKAVQGKLERVCAALSEDSEKPNAKFENMFFLQLQSRALDNIYKDDDRVQAEEYIAFEETFNEASVRLSMLMHTVPKVEAVTPTIQQPPQPYLPPLQVPLPEFDGSYEKLYTFKARFTSVMKHYPQEDDCTIYKHVLLAKRQA